MKNICFQMTRKAWLVLAAVLCLSFPALAQNVIVTGTVHESDGEPAIGASVTLKGQTTGVATDIDGNYRIEAPANGTLVFSYIGYNSQEVAVDGRTSIDVTLQSSTAALNELVVVGYGVVKKSDATGSVAVIKPDEIEAGLATSAQEMLVGASPGVVVTTDGGNPAGGADILIRGGASLAASNAPLIVVDGVPIERSTVKGSSNALGLVSPENVESMTILKDASATAIYGSRASNGVIIITTKKGQAGKPQVNFTANMYVNTPRKTMDMMDGNTFANYVIDRYGADSNQAAALGVNGTIYNTDWQDEVLRTSVSSDYSISVGGTAGVLPYRVALSYTNNNGIIKTSSMDRATASINLTPKFFDDLLSVNFNVKGAYITNRYQKGVLGGAVSFNPTLPVFMPGGNNLNNYTSYGNGGSLISGDNGVKINTLQALNPVAELMDYSSKSKVYQSIGNLQLDLKMPFLRELRANLNLAYDYSHGECTNFNMPFSPSAWKDGHYVPGSDVSVRDGYTTKYKENEERYNLLLDFYLNYNKEFKDINSAIDLTAGYSWQKFKFSGHNYSFVNAPGMDFDGYQRTPTVYYSKPYQLLSYFGRLNYTFMDRYLITATVRRDGTSRFSKDYRWGTFPAVALGWKLLDESFMEGARSFMNELKLRGGYGVTGQQDLGEQYLYFYMPVFNQSTNMNQMYLGPDGKYHYTVMPEAYNTALKWEETHTWNAGVDFAFLNNRITGSFDFYKRKTKDLLTVANYTIGSNLSNRGPQNLGDLENIGVEFNLVTRPVVTKEFTWTSSYNVAWNKNKVTRLAEGADSTTGNIGTAGDVMKHQEGFPAFSFWVYEQVYNADGTPMEGVFVDRNGDGVITGEDRYLYHSKDPAVTMNWSNNFSYKNWDFGFTLRSSIGNWLYNKNEVDNSFASNTSVPPLSNLMNNTYLWQSKKTDQMQLSDYFVRNASYVRCDNITLGYTWSQLLNNALRLRLYGAVQNPFVITKYKGVDPEVGSGIDGSVYPRPTTFTVGVVASF